MALEDIDVLKAVPVEGDYQVIFHNQIATGMKSLKTLEQTTNTTVLKTIGGQTVAGEKTFDSSPVIPASTLATHAVNKTHVDSAISDTELAITAGTISQYYRGDKSMQTIDKSAAGLGSVSNTSDSAKPVSTALQTALNTKQNTLPVNLLANAGFENGTSNWTFNNITLSTDYARTGTYSAKYVGGSGLGEIFSEAFPVTDGQVVTVVGYIYQPGSITSQGVRIQAQRISDDGWVQISAATASSTGVWERDTLTYTVDGATYDHVRLRFGFNSPYTAYVDDAELYIDGVTSASQYLRGDITFQRLDNYAVGLGNVDNTSDADKPISTAQQEALDLKKPSLGTGEAFQYLRGGEVWITLDKTAVGIGSINNTSDLSKPISGPQQTALDGKATASLTLLLSGAQTIAGVKTFSSSPKWGTATVGQVWKATATDGSGSWQDIGTLTTTVDWDNVTSKPATFAPIIGATADTAAAGNHTHTKADIGLGDADNTSDADKPISTATQSALNTKVSTSRSLNTSAHFSGGGVLSADKTVAIQDGGIGLSELEDAAKTFGIAYIQTLDTRAVGLGQIDDGITFETAVTITSVKYRMGTADASGTTTVELRKNGVAVSGTSATASLTPSAVTGTWTFAAGDKLTVYTTAIGTTPGKRLTADIIAKLG